MKKDYKVILVDENLGEEKIISHLREEFKEANISIKCYPIRKHSEMELILSDLKDAMKSNEIEPQFILTF